MFEIDVHMYTFFSQWQSIFWLIYELNMTHSYDAKIFGHFKVP